MGRLTAKDLGRDSQYRYDTIGMDFEKNLGLTGRYCYSPFNDVTIDRYGDCYVCVCQAWLPLPVGNIMDFNSLSEIVQSPKAREIQSSITDGSYRYCDHKTCHLLIDDGMLHETLDGVDDSVTRIVFAIDPSCNLRCPSCRKELIFLKEGESFDQGMRMVEHIANLINNHPLPLSFTVSGDGDPFASHIYRKLLSRIQSKETQNINVEIDTNGILAKDHWKYMSGIHNVVKKFKISFDAGSPEVYAITRRGGSWTKLLESTRYIVEWKRAHQSSMTIALNFVVQTANFRDIVKFVQLGEQLGVDLVEFQKVVDWGTFGKQFAEHAVWQPDHANHAELVEILNEPVLDTDLVELHNLIHLKKYKD